jgi:YesN/AraC family two-component response regulator
MSYNILIVDDEKDVREMLHQAVKDWSFTADVAPGAKEAIMLMKMNNYDIIITDKNMPGKDGDAEGGMYVLRHAKAVLPAAEVIMITAYANLESAIEAMRQGAFDYLKKPFELEELKEIIDRIIEYKNYSDSGNALKLYREIFNKILKLAQTQYKPDDKELHWALRSILDKFYNFFIIQKNTERAFKNIYKNAEKLRESIHRTDPKYKLVLNIEQEIDKQLKKT